MLIINWDWPMPLQARGVMSQGCLQGDESGEFAREHKEIKPVPTVDGTETSGPYRGPPA